MLNNINYQHNNNTDKYTTTYSIVEGINYCFSKYVDNRSLQIGYNLLKSMKVPISDINTLMLWLAVICTKHYKRGYIAAHNHH